MTKTINKIAYLDGIRGIASFFVFFHHFSLAFYSAFYSFDINNSNLNGLEIRYGQSVFSVFSNGHFFVFVFFVLSGLVLSRKYFQTQNFEVITSGANRRFLRLYIPVATTLIIAYLMMKANLFYNVQVSQLRHSEWWFGGMWVFPDPLLRLWQALYAGTMFKGDSMFDTSLWTMALEFTGSLFVFGFLAFTHHAKKRFFTLFLVFLYCIFVDQTILITFVFGISLNYVDRLPLKNHKFLLNSLALILLIFSLLLGSFPSNNLIENTVFEHLGHTLINYNMWFHPVGAYLFVLSFVISGSLQKFISLRLFRFLGYVSFSLYLLHPLIIGSFSSFLYVRLHVPVPFIFVLTTICCMIISWLMTRFIDEPGVRFSKYVYERWFKKKEAIPAAVTSYQD